MNKTDNQHLVIFYYEDKRCAGYRSPCPDWLKDLYRQAVNYTCEQCNKPEDIVGKLSPHRRKRGEKGGLYTVLPLSHPANNVRVLCDKCHKLHHSNEYSNVKAY